jgi:hypothetical protein
MNDNIPRSVRLTDKEVSDIKKIAGTKELSSGIKELLFTVKVSKKLKALVKLLAE